MEPILHLICNRQWMVNELSSNSLVPVEHSFGYDIPFYSSSDSWWIPQEMATRFIQSGVKFNFQSPGAFWLDNVPLELRGRNVKTIPAGDIAVNENLNEINFWKFAEAKVDTFIAGIRTGYEVLDYINTYKVPSNSMLQKSDFLKLKNEYRFFIVEGEIVTSSLYLTRKNGEELTYYDYDIIDVKESEAVTAYVASVAPVLASPEAYVLDVATTCDGNIIVLEANPAWCSAWYGAGINKVAETILASNVATKKWHYSPDSLLLEKYRKMVPLPYYKK